MCVFSAILPSPVSTIMVRHFIHCILALQHKGQHVCITNVAKYITTASKREQLLACKDYVAHLMQIPAASNNSK